MKDGNTRFQIMMPAKITKKSNEKKVDVCCLEIIRKLCAFLYDLNIYQPESTPLE